MNTHGTWIGIAIAAALAVPAGSIADTTGPVGPDPAPEPAGIQAGPEILKKIEIAVAKLADEPSLDELKAAALRLADADVNGARGWMRSTNLSAMLPIVKVTAEHDIERDESLDRYQDEPDRWGADTDRDLGLQVSMQWNLGELIFNPDEVRVYSALANRAERREALLTMLVGYYFERRRLMISRLINPPADPEKALAMVVRIDELTAIMDALTGGQLSRTLKRRRSQR